jgi:hypothetical protein
MDELVAAILPASLPSAPPDSPTRLSVNPMHHVASGQPPLVPDRDDLIKAMTEKRMKLSMFPAEL